MGSVPTSDTGDPRTGAGHNCREISQDFSPAGITKEWGQSSLLTLVMRERVLVNRNV